MGRPTGAVSRRAGERVVVRHSRKRNSRKTAWPARFFSSRGVPAPRSFRRIRLRLNAHVDQLPFQDVLPPPQMAASHTASLVAVREAAFDQLPAPSE
jgi:hypothetical protein